MSRSTLKMLCAGILFSSLLGCSDTGLNTPMPDTLAEWNESPKVQEAVQALADEERRLYEQYKAELRLSEQAFGANLSLPRQTLGDVIEKQQNAEKLKLTAAKNAAERRAE